MTDNESNQKDAKPLFFIPQLHLLYRWSRWDFQSYHADLGTVRRVKKVMGVSRKTEYGKPVLVRRLPPPQITQENQIGEGT